MTFRNAHAQPHPAGYVKAYGVCIFRKYPNVYEMIMTELSSCTRRPIKYDANEASASNEKIRFRRALLKFGNGFSKSGRKTKLDPWSACI